MVYSSYYARDMGLMNGLKPSWRGHRADRTQQDVIDPGLTGDASQIQQFLQDPDTPAVFGMHPMPMNDFSFGMEGRHGSPSSQQQSSAASPGTENDIFYDRPSTPPDMKSPFLPQVYDAWDSQISLRGLSSCRPGRFVNPSDIHGSQVSLCDLNEGEGPKDFNLGPGFDNFDINNPSPHYPGNHLAHTPLLRVSSPASEIHVRSSLDPVYPDPENIGEGANSAEEASVKLPSQTGENQGRMPTTTRSKPTRASKSANGRGRPKRQATASLTEPSKVTKNTSSSRTTNSRRLPSTSSPIKHTCPHCPDMTFKDDATLQKHIKTQHRRPFICVFHFAGCPEAFANKNEWKRHVSAQHLCLQFWLCSATVCENPPDQEHKASGKTTLGRPFRRKDLYTQHVRRMHPPSPPTDVRRSNKNASRGRDDPLKAMQDSAFRKRCEMPTHMRCPVLGCTQQFQGEKTWDDRMEHVARHLERAASNEEPRVQFGGAHDDTLIEWASSESVGVIERAPDGSWRLGQPLEGIQNKSKRKSSARASPKATADEDAEGEAC
ncbi:hypothetical protein BKA56DRAFT_613378 [Ilyonectria sp. MPI-CAGE-AT-0026]|nr:hypothetical protein BKA56DRAFT_613378 [Ilyonectria sp. MPI-CAGE-AT-0026]